MLSGSLRQFDLSGQTAPTSLSRLPFAISSSIGCVPLVALWMRCVMHRAACMRSFWNLASRAERLCTSHEPTCYRFPPATRAYANWKRVSTRSRASIHSVGGSLVSHRSMAARASFRRRCSIAALIGCLERRGCVGCSRGAGFSRDLWRGPLERSCGALRGFVAAAGASPALIVES